MSKMAFERYVGQDVYIHIPVHAQCDPLTYRLALEYNGVLTTITRVKELRGKANTLMGRLVEVRDATSREGVHYTFDAHWVIPFEEYEVR